MLVFAAMTTEETAGRRQNGMSDEALFPKIAAGEKAAFCSLYEQTAGAVYAYALSVLRDRHDAEDAMQETFLKIRGAAHLYRPQGRPMAWIFTITRNICLMHFRRQRQYLSDPQESDPADCGLDRIRNAEDRLVLEAAMDVLSTEERQIIMLHAVAGLKHRETAALMDLPLATVLSKYSRSLKKLRAELEKKR